MMETEMEQDDLPKGEDQAGIGATQTDPGLSVFTETNATSSDSGPVYVLRREKSLPRLRESSNR
jgi:hypothetical protein